MNTVNNPPTSPFHRPRGQKVQKDSIAAHYHGDRRAASAEQYIPPGILNFFLFFFVFKENCH